MVGSHKTGSGAPVAVVAVELPVASVVTSVIGVEVPAPAAGEFARDACEWIRLPMSLSPLAPAAGGGAGGSPTGLCFLEDHMRVSPGFGSIVWDCAVMCSLALAALGPRVLAGQRVCDLGCGTGVVGLAAAAAGAQVSVRASQGREVASLATLIHTRTRTLTRTRTRTLSLRCCSRTWRCSCR
jgi:hypothetical protein